MEITPCAVPAVRDTHRDTIGRDDFLQLRLPLVGLLDADEIEGMLDAARGCNNVAPSHTPIVDPILEPPADDQQTSAAPAASAPIRTTLQRQARTTRSEARCSALEHAPIDTQLDTVREEEDSEGDEHDGENTEVKPVRKLG